jgi:hypothetical protein
MTKQTLLSWCDQQVKDGKELKRQSGMMQEDKLLEFLS